MYLELYKKFAKTGRMNHSGLCLVFDNLEVDTNQWLELKIDFSFIHPTREDKLELRKYRQNDIFWGSDSDDPKHFIFTSLRANLLLLLACLNNEL